MNWRENKNHLHRKTTKTEVETKDYTRSSEGKKIIDKFQSSLVLRTERAISSCCSYIYIPILQLIFVLFSFISLTLHNLLLRFSINKHQRAMMVHHVPPAVMELENIRHIEQPIVHVNIGFHGNPSHFCKYPCTYIPNLEATTMIPIKCQLPALHNRIVTAFCDPIKKLVNVSRLLILHEKQKLNQIILSG